MVKYDTTTLVLQHVDTLEDYNAAKSLACFHDVVFRNYIRATDKELRIMTNENKTLKLKVTCEEIAVTFDDYSDDDAQNIIDEIIIHDKIRPHIYTLYIERNDNNFCINSSFMNLTVLRIQLHVFNHQHRICVDDTTNFKNLQELSVSMNHHGNFNEVWMKALITACNLKTLFLQRMSIDLDMLLNNCLKVETITLSCCSVKNLSDDIHPNVKTIIVMDNVTTITYSDIYFFDSLEKYPALETFELHDYFENGYDVLSHISHVKTLKLMFFEKDACDNVETELLCEVLTCSRSTFLQLNVPHLQVLTLCHGYKEVDYLHLSRSIINKIKSLDHLTKVSLVNEQKCITTTFSREEFMMKY